jgi:carbon storage regulator
MGCPATAGLAAADKTLLCGPKDGCVIHDEGGKAMLVITRRIGEEVVIDDKIKVVVLNVQGDRVRLGIGAQANVRVDQQEVHDRRPFAPNLPPSPDDDTCLSRSKEDPR